MVLLAFSILSLQTVILCSFLYGPSYKSQFTWFTPSPTRDKKLRISCRLPVWDTATNVSVSFWYCLRSSSKPARDPGILPWHISTIFKLVIVWHYPAVGPSQAGILGIIGADRSGSPKQTLVLSAGPRNGVVLGFFHSEAGIVFFTQKLGFLAPTQ